MLAVALSHHVLAPASLSTLRALVTRVRADVIATLVQDGGFRTVEDGLTMHIREKAPDGSVPRHLRQRRPRPRRIAAVHRQERDAAGARRRLVPRPAERRPDPREPHQGREQRRRVRDLCARPQPARRAQCGAHSTRRRSARPSICSSPRRTIAFTEKFPERVAAEIHDRTTAPLYTPRLRPDRAGVPRAAAHQPPGPQLRHRRRRADLPGVPRRRLRRSRSRPPRRAQRSRSCT